MKHSELSESDVERLSGEIQVYIIITVLLFVLVVVFFGLSFSILALLGIAPDDGLNTVRAKVTVLFLAVVSVTMNWKTILKYADLKNKRKTCFSTEDYRLMKSEDDLTLIVTKPFTLKLEIDEDLEALIDFEKPIQIEVSKWTKTLLFISQDGRNLLDIIDAEHE